MKKEITPKEYVNGIEDELYNILEQNNYKSLPFPLLNSSGRQKKIFCAVISSILFRQAACIADTEYNNNKQIATIFNIIFKINAIILTKNNEEIYKIFNENAAEILKELKKYFKRKQQNYILKQLPLHIINSHKNIKDLLDYNPFMFQECFEYYCNPLTYEEQIIGEILKMKNQYTGKDNSNSMAQNLLIDMVKKYKDERFNEVLLFIICNVYQNALETNNQKLINLTKYCIENPQVSNQNIIDYFIDKEGNNTHPTNELVYVIQEFIRYNEHIKEGTLEHLKNQPSNQYIKERLKKPN